MPDKQQRESDKQPERQLTEAAPEISELSAPAQDAELQRAVGGVRPPTNPGTGSSGTPTNRTVELAGDVQRDDILIESAPEPAPAPPAPEPSPSESEKSDS